MVRCGSYDGGAERKTTNESYQNSPGIFVDEADWSEPSSESGAPLFDVGSQHLAVLALRFKLRFQKTDTNLASQHQRRGCRIVWRGYIGQSVTAAP